MIVKVQVALVGHGAGRLLLIYDEERTFNLQCENPDVLKLLKRRPKAYFDAEIVSTDDGNKIQINGEVEEQDW